MGGLELIYWILIERKVRGQYDIDITTPIINLFVAQASLDGYAPSVALWFVPCLMVVSIAFYLLSKKCKRLLNVVTVLYAIFSIAFGYTINKYNVVRLPWALDVAGIALLFYTLGYYLVYNKYLERISKISGTIFFVFSVFVTACGSYMNGRVDMRGCGFGNPILFLLTAISGTYCCYYLSTAISKKNRKFDIIKFMGLNSLIIMCVHEPIKRMVIKVFEILLKSYIVDVRENVITTVFIAVATLLICVPIILIVNKYFPILAGKRKKTV